jgi:hypothetical protein
MANHSQGAAVAVGTSSGSAVVTSPAVVTLVNIQPPLARYISDPAISWVQPPWWDSAAMGFNRRGA